MNLRPALSVFSRFRRAISMFQAFANVPAALLPITLLSLVIGVAPGHAADLTQDYLRTPNFPRSDRLPSEKRPELLDGLALSAGAISLAALTFTPGGTTDTRAKLDAQVYYNSIFGNQQTVVGSDGIEGDTGSNFTRPRRYAPNNPFNLLNFTPEGLNFGTVCSNNNSPDGCTPGHVYGAMIRLPTVILPGDIVSVTMKTGNSPLFWTGAAMYAAVQTTPGPGGNPYEGTGSVHYARCYGEIDVNDDYKEPHIPVGQQLKMGALAIYSYADNANAQCFRIAAHEVYDADGPHFAYHANDGHPYASLRRGVTYDRMHTYTAWITDDGSNLIHFFFDGMLVSTQYYEPNLTTYRDKAGMTRKVGYSLVIAAQTIPNFLNPDHDIKTGVYAHIRPNDGGPIVGGPWSATVQSIKIIRGSISPAALAASRVDTDGTDHAHYAGLVDHVAGH
jgi:hypothetical protein